MTNDPQPPAAYDPDTVNEVRIAKQALDNLLAAWPDVGSLNFTWHLLADAQRAMADWIAAHEE